MSVDGPGRPMGENQTRHRPAWVDWLFASRTEGRIVIAQWPNAMLWVVIATAAASWLLHPDGVAGVAVSGLGAAALVVWAVMEIGWGVNPFRRGLGAVVLAMDVMGWAIRLLRR